MAFTKINAAGIGTTETVTVDGLTVINDGSFGGNLTVSGVLTYEDVTNVDSVGLITARNGIVVGSGITLSKDGDGFFTGIVTATSFSGSGANLTGIDTDLVSDTSPQLGGNLDAGTRNIDFDDNGKLRLGTGNDLQIHHTSNISTINDSYGDLRIMSDTIRIQRQAGGENFIYMTEGGTVRLHYDGINKFETTSAGGTLTGDLTVTGIIYGGSHISILDSDGSSDMLKIGTDEDLRIYHYNNNTYIRQHTDKPLVIGGTSTGQTLYLSPKDGEYAAIFKPNAEVELYHDNALRLETQSAGVEITGKLTFANDGLANGSIDLGADADLNLYHDNSDAYMDNNTGAFYIRNSGANPNEVYIQGKGGENSIVAHGDGGVDLFYDHSRKFFTQNLGVTVESIGNTPEITFRGASNLDLGKIDVDQFSSNYSMMRFFTLNNGTETERMRILDNGSILFGTTSQANTGSYFQADNNDRMTLNTASSSTSTQNQIIFRNPNGRVGHIQTSGTGTLYNTSFSDRDAKKNFENWDEDVLSLFKNINPQKFNFKVEDDSASKSKGFIAQEMTDKFPEAYPKEEDDLYQFNPSGMVVYLMKAVQELSAKVSALEG